MEERENQEFKNVNIDSLEEALSLMAKEIVTNPTPISLNDIRKIALEFEDLEYEEFKSLSVKLNSILKQEGRVDTNRRREIISEMLGKNVQEEKEIEAEVEEFTDLSFLRNALVDIAKIILEPGAQLTRMEIEAVSYKVGVDYELLKIKARELNTKIFNIDLNTQQILQTIDEIIGYEMEEDLEVEGLEIEKNELIKERSLEEMKKIYLNSPNRFTISTIENLGLSVSEVKAMIPLWREEKKRDILEE